MANIAPDVTKLITSFAEQIIAATEAAAAERIQAAMTTAFGAPVKRGPGRPKSAPTAVHVPAASKPTAGRKPPKTTAKLARARRLQGRYLGALRGLGQADRAKVKSVAKSKSVAEALKLALSLKKKA